VILPNDDLPSIDLNPAKRATGSLPSDKNTIVVGVWMLEPGEDLIVAPAPLEAQP
jgi:hypothetical protein